MKTVVMLLGPSSAGKSTTCGALQNTHGWRTCSIDEECEKVAAEFDKHTEAGLAAKGLFDKLAPFMSKEQVLALASKGILEFTRDGQKLFIHKFSNPDYVSLQRVLKRAGFNKEEQEILLPLISSVGESFRESAKTYVHPILEHRLFENAFDHGNADESVVIDMVPLGTPEETVEMVDAFNKKADEYKAQHGEDSIQVVVVLAYCPPMKLSDRLYQRNVNAEREQQYSNKRAWQQGFHHLGMLYSAKNASPNDSSTLDTLSHAELMKVSYTHNEKKPVGLSNANPYVLSNVQLFKNAARAAIDANKFSKVFGIPNHSDGARLAVAPQLKHDAIIDTSSGTPDDLAEKVIAATEAKTAKNRLK